MLISSSAQISRQADVGPGADIGPFCVVHAGVRIDADVRIGPFCEIGVPAPCGRQDPLTIGRGVLIRSHSVLYAGATLGDEVETGHHVTIRERARLGRGVRVGTFSDIQGDCDIGDWVRLHSSVFVSKLSVIRTGAWLMPRVVLTNDPTPPSDDQIGCTIGCHAVVSAAATILPGIHVGDRSLVGAHACVTADVPADMVVFGNPARVIGPTSNVRRRATQGVAYPWMERFHRGYPQHVVDGWLGISGEA